MKTLAIQKQKEATQKEVFALAQRCEHFALEKDWKHSHVVGGTRPSLWNFHYCLHPDAPRDTDGCPEHCELTWRGKCPFAKNNQRIPIAPQPARKGERRMT